MTARRLRPARREDTAEIAAIYNDGIRSGKATFETRPRQASDIAQWLEHGDIVVVSEDERGIAGFASTSTYRPRACYDDVKEFSVYVRPDALRQGHASALLRLLILQARERGIRKLVSRIFVENEASRSLVRSLGFREVGIYEKHGRVEGRWHDCAIVELLIEPRPQ